MWHHPERSAAERFHILTNQGALERCSFIVLVLLFRPQGLFGRKPT